MRDEMQNLYPKLFGKKVIRRSKYNVYEIMMMMMMMMM